MKKSKWTCSLAAGMMAVAIAGGNPAVALADSPVVEQGTDQREVIEETEPVETETEPELPQEATEEEIDAYFDGSVLVGDSVMLGFRNYSMRRQNTFLGKISFLASGSFSVHNALQPVTAKSTHPVYQGQKRLIWESISMMQAKKVFLFFGLNDMNISGAEGTCAKYQQLIANIKQLSPDAEIHIMSMTYTLAGKGKGKLNNDTIRRFNDLLRQMCLENGWGFVDIVTPLADANGNLAPAYCSDHYVHQTTAAYDVWTAVLRQYAKSQLEGTAAYPYRAVMEDHAEESSEAETGVEETGEAETRTEESSETGEAETRTEESSETGEAEIRTEKSSETIWGEIV